MPYIITSKITCKYTESTVVQLLRYPQKLFYFPGRYCMKCNDHFRQFSQKSVYRQLSEEVGVSCPLDEYKECLITELTGNDDDLSC